jgi:hypothetical protein
MSLPKSSFAFKRPDCMGGTSMGPLKARFLLILICMFQWACQIPPNLAGTDRTRRQISADEGKRIGQKYFDEHAPQWKDEYARPSTVIDHGDYWEYTFPLPVGMVGGSPVVYIDKRTLQVTKMFHEQ